MARVSARQGQYGKEFSVNLSHKESTDSSLRPEGEYEFVKAKPGIWLLVEKQVQEKGAEQIAKEAIDTHIISLLRRKTLAERVEGKFEKFLDDKELKRFRELVLEGKIEKFRMSEKYKKSVYVVAAKEGEAAGWGAGGIAKGKGAAQGAQENAKAKEQAAAQQGSPATASRASTAPAQGRAGFSQGKMQKSEEQVALAKDGFVSMRSESIARMLSEELAEEIRIGKVRGIKSFDGNFYIVMADTYCKYADPVLGYIKQNGTASTADIAGKFHIEKALAKAVCEFLREDSEIAERQKDIYKYIA